MVNSKKDISTEAKILAAARTVFLKKGMDGARMQDIADAAGINKAMLHYYFRSKEKLFEMIFREMIAHLLPRMNEILDSDKTFFKKIEMFCSEYINHIMEVPYIPVFILSEINRQPQAFVEKIWEGNKPPIKKFLKLVQNEIEKGNIRAIDPMQFFLNILSMCIFPFAARPMLILLGGLSEGQFKKLMENRKREVAAFIIAAIKK